MNQAIRAVIETKIASQLSIPICFDNVQDSPPNYPYAVCIISYNDVSLPTVCFTGDAVEQINGNLQISIFTEKSQGMGQLDLYSQNVFVAMNTMYDPQQDAKVKCGRINGPVTVFGGTEQDRQVPYTLVTISCPFTASYTASVP